MKSTSLASAKRRLYWHDGEDVAGRVTTHPKKKGSPNNTVNPLKSNDLRENQNAAERTRTSTGLTPTRPSTLPGTQETRLEHRENGDFDEIAERMHLRMHQIAEDSKRSIALGVLDAIAESFGTDEEVSTRQNPVSEYLQLLSDTDGYSLAQTQLELAFLFTRWQNLPQHIRQTIMTLVRSVETPAAKCEVW